MPDVDALRVVTHKRWVADELSVNTIGVVVESDLGFDMPPPGRAFWCPTEWAARAGLSMQAPGPHWLSSAPWWALHRRIETVPLADLRSGAVRWTSPRFAKVAEAKPQNLPAGVRSTLSGFLVEAAAAGLPDGSWIQLTTPTSFDLEVRCFVLDGRVVAHSPYLVNGQTWHEGMSINRFDAARALLFAGRVADAVPGPRGYVLDVGRTNGIWSVVEANPAWSSAFYGADIDGVVVTVLAANGADPTGEWDWRPDAWLIQRAARQRPLHESVETSPSSHRASAGCHRLPE